MELKHTKSVIHTTSRAKKEPEQQPDTSVGSPLFRRRAVQFARLLGFEHENYDDLPENVRKTIECLGYKHFLNVLMQFDRARGQSVRQVAQRYGVTNRVVQYGTRAA